ncbi:MAG: hypothetical protein JOZ43_02325 [Acidobacteriales bacterium]|nr:hypothetical protein [Terriglobales bacterium]
MGMKVYDVVVIVAGAFAIYIGWRAERFTMGTVWQRGPEVSPVVGKLAWLGFGILFVVWGTWRLWSGR